MLFLENQLPNLHGIFTKLKLKQYPNRRCQKCNKKKFSTSDSFCLIASQMEEVCWCDKQNQSEVGYNDLKIKSNKAENVFCFLVFCNLQVLIYLKPTDQFQCGFLQNAVAKMVNTVTKMKTELTRLFLICLITPPI